MNTRNRNLLRALAPTWKAILWRRVLVLACILLFSASVLFAPVANSEGSIFAVYPARVAQGYPANSDTFPLTLYFDDTFGGAPTTVEWVNAPGGIQNLPIAEDPGPFYVKVNAPKAMTNDLGLKQFRICRDSGTVCTDVSKSDVLTVIRPQVTNVDPEKVTVGVGDQFVQLSYLLARSDTPAESPSVFLVNSASEETPLSVSSADYGVPTHYVDVLVPAIFFQSPGVYKFRIEEEYDGDGNTPQSTDISVEQATLQVVEPAVFVTPSPLPPAQLDPSAPDYSVFIEASGGSPEPSEGDDDYYYSYYILRGENVPAGLTFSGSFAPKAQLSGRPTGPAGKYAFTVYVEDRFGVESSKLYRMGVQTPAPALSITTSALPQATAGLSYSASITANGGVPGYEFTIAPGGRGMPGGLVLASDGSITGVPTSEGTFVIDVLAEDSQLRQAVRAIPLTILPQFPPLSFNTAATLPDAEVGTPYLAKIESAGGAPPVRIIVGEGLLPAGLAIDNATGIISGTPTRPTEASFLVTARDAQNRETSRMFSIRVLDQQAPLSITTQSPLPQGEVGESYSASIVATGGRTPYLFSIVNGALPSGLELNSASGIITGKTTQAGVFRFTLQVASPNDGESATREFLLEVLGSVRLLTQSPLPDGQVGSGYSLNFAVQGGNPPYLFSIIEGQLPAGLTLDPATGSVTGIPTAPSSGSFTLRVRDSSSTPAVASRTYALRVLSPLEITVLELPVGTVNMPYSLQFSAQGGVPPYSFALAGGNLPAGIVLASNGLLAGSASAPAVTALSVQVTDAEGATAQRSYTLRIQTPPVTGGAINLSSSVGISNTQNEVDVTLSAPQDEELTGVVTLTMNSLASPPVDDPTVQFISGGRTAPFRIPAGQTSATFGSSPSARFQTGTTAATLVFTATFARGGADATPNPAPQASLTIPVTPPTITDLSVTRNANTLTVLARGFAPERNISTVVLEFTRRSGAPGNNPERFEVNVAQAFQDWFKGSGSQAFGSQFKLTIPVTLTGDPAEITGLSLRLNGPAGTGNSLNATF